MRLNIIFSVLGYISKYIGFLFIIPIMASFILKEYGAIYPFLYTGIIAIVLSFVFSINKADKKEIDNIKKAESLAIVFFSWVFFALICSIPYLFYGFSFTDSIFEATSGITTTGATIFKNFNYPKTLFFFRSLTQWFGGMGIIVLFIAVLPKISVAGRQMFYAEAPAPTEDKVTPRIRYTATWLWSTYLALTLAEVIVLKFLGLDFYSSIVTSLSTISTGGFSYLSGSIMDFHSVKVTVCVLVFMFLSGINYILIYKSFKNKKCAPVFKSEEFKSYLFITLVLTLFLTISLCINSNYEFKTAILNSAFQIVTTMTTTGFAVDNYINWDAVSKIILFIAFFTGGCAMSTSGGVKIIRWVFVGKYLKRELNKIVHPQAVYPIKLEGKTLDRDILSQMMAFVVFYFVVFSVGALLITMFEKSGTVGLSASATAIGNIGPGYSIVGPMDTFGNLHLYTKWVITLLMLIGRLEIIPFLALLNRDLWKN